MKYAFWIGFLALCLAGGSVGASQEHSDAVSYQTAFTNIEARDSIDLSGPWHYIVDPQKIGILRGDRRRTAVFEDVSEPDSPVDFLEYNFDAAPVMEIPGDWNGRDSTLTWFDGLVWFRKVLELDAPPSGRTFLHIGAANYKALVHVNGEKVGEHEGGFTPFAFDVTSQLKRGRNSIVIGVDATHEDDSIPTPITDWKTYGGLTRPVHLVTVPDTWVHDYFVRLEAGDRLQAMIRLGGGDVAGRKVSLEIPELDLALQGSGDKSGVASFDVDIPKGLERWSPVSPKLYDVTVSIDGDAVTDRIGFRTVGVDGSQILLNGEPIFLRGISIHEETLGEPPGRAFDEDSARALLNIAKNDLNANFVRLAHYPHAEVMTRLADEMGLLVWSEIPVYWDVAFDNPQTLETALRMQQENIVRDRNRASVIFWSVGNETPQTEERLAFFDAMIRAARAMDDTRLMTAALHNVRSEGQVYVVDDPLAELIDVVAVNTYQGWYGRAPLTRVPGAEWQNPSGKPFLFSEFGAGAMYGFHDPEMEKFSEEFQEAYYKVTLEMVAKVPGLAGLSPWILKDFQSPRRMHHEYQDYWNRKGLISPEGDKKKAFFVLRDWYREIAKQ
ncbi:MAG: glycoside hydrolase family 2 TIM barrel-domain containing protein [Xanthomonadales bacterium]|jgi:beta-glucuronidase|nr:glycoside hydrolase family 2 TIM barrel-domain containing protein [Xanthomonadales bacterium]